MAAIIDIGAVRSVVGFSNAQRIARTVGDKLQLTTPRRKVRFGVPAHGSPGSFEILIPTPGGVMRVCPDVVKADVAFMLGPDALDQNKTASKR